MKIQMFNFEVRINDEQPTEIMSKVNNFISCREVVDIKQSVSPCNGKSGLLNVVITVMYK